MSPFGALYYTDCLPGQGLGGGAGFQFQARSEHLDDDVERAVTRAGLYEVPPRWMRERRPVDSYPLSLAHLALDDGGGWMTAAGRYLGQEANGHRDGNQFTHAVVTRDVRSYALVRPAQFWAAPWWSDTPAPTTTCPPVPANPTPGPWTTEAVRDHVRRSPGRLTALVSALGALRGPSRRRVLLVTDDASEAACWIAAGTLLLDRRRALAVGFKIFVLDPDRSPHDVLAVHPDWSAPFERNGGYLVLDLRSSEVPDVETSDDARFWVPRFLAGDPLDVVDAVELAGQLAREIDAAGSLPGAVERGLASLAVGVDDDLPPAELRAVAERLELARGSALDLLGAPALGALAQRSGDAEALRCLDTAVTRRAGLSQAEELGWADVAADVRRRLFLLEVDAAGRGVPAERLPLLPTGHDGTERSRLERLPAPEALALADRHGVDPSDETVERFVVGWADHPRDDARAREWRSRPRVLDALYRELDRRLRVDDRAARTATDVAEFWWSRPEELWRSIPVLGAVSEPPGVSRLDLAVARAAFRAGGEARGTALARIAGEAGASRPDVDPWTLTWDLVLGRGQVGSREVRRFLQVVPPDARSEALATVAYASLLVAPGFDDDARTALALLESAGWPPQHFGHAYPPDDPEIAVVVDALRAGTRLDRAEDLGHHLARARRGPTATDQRRLWQALVAGSPALGGRVLRACGPNVVRERTVVPLLLQRARAEGTRVGDPGAVAVLFTLAVLDRRGRSEYGDALLTDLAGPVRGLGDVGLRAVHRRLLDDPERPADDAVPERWRQWAGSLAAPSRATTPRAAAPDGSRPPPADHPEKRPRKPFLPWRRS
ncbi:hypothetical protein ACFPBZ_17980 [Actinomycetospora atypica]|uniref:Uncharacterized protein n=2 Tax=Actinomycetospora atypica TaxID=1290095 RepID=A0ABV9YQD2_9PSEU